MSHTAPAAAQPTISEQETHSIGVDAYLYFYSSVSIDLSRAIAFDRLS
jgi:hypothetical protein